MGSAGIARLIAHSAFWGLMLVGVVSGELGMKACGVFVLLWVLGLFGLPYLPFGDSLFPSYVALLDVALVFVIFKGDVTLT
jgi:hypothetical protein